MASDNSEWAGVVGTVTTQMSKKMAEHAERTEATVKDMVAKKTEHLVEQLMSVRLSVC